ncbi:MAG: coproporphyrinogen-III oxidase family protein, partial [Longimicrobiales bacterium]
LERRASFAPGAEWTAEANPESFDAALATDWRAAGVNRVSLGAQTFAAPALRWMGRLHGQDGPGRALAAARAAGIENVSIDLIFALPARLERDWAADLDRALALEPSHVSLYGLTAEEATPLGRSVREGRERMADEETYAAEYLLAAERLAAAGFEHYEVSNFARPGRQSRHNAAYWDGRAYLGLGPGAHSFLPPVRSWNARDWEEYRQRAEAGESTNAGQERVTGRAARLERTWLALRTAAGLPTPELGDVARGTVADWVAHGWAAADYTRVALTPRGWLLLDRLAVELTDALERDERLTLSAGRGQIRRPMQTEGAHG